MGTVSLVIPNWNGRDHLEVCLTSIAAQSKRPDRTILVDNGSSDDSLSFVADKFPWVECIAFPRNLGFAAAVNRGIGVSNEAYVALLNNDTELDARWLDEMLRGLASDTSAGMAACKMLRFDDRTTIDAAGDALTWGGSPLTLGAGEQDGEKFNRRRYVSGTCAGAALYKRSMFSRIGLFDEDFVSYYEDADLSLRAQLAGYRCVYVPAAVCYHKRGATSALLKDFPVRMQERNLTALHVKNLPASVLLEKAPLILMSRVRRLWRELLAGVGTAAVVGLLQGVVLVPRMLRKRKDILALRSVPADYIASLFGSRRDR